MPSAQGRALLLKGYRYDRWDRGSNVWSAAPFRHRQNVCVCFTFVKLLLMSAGKVSPAGSFLLSIPSWLAFAKKEPLSGRKPLGAGRKELRTWSKRWALGHVFSLHLSLLFPPLSALRDGRRCHDQLHVLIKQDFSALSPSALAFPGVLHLLCPKGSCSLVAQQDPTGIPTRCLLLPLGGAAPSWTLASAQQRANSTEEHLPGTELHTSAASQWGTRDPWRCSSSQQQRTCSSLLTGSKEKVFSKLSCPLHPVLDSNAWTLRRGASRVWEGSVPQGMSSFGYEHKLGRMWTEMFYQGWENTLGSAHTGSTLG